MKSIHFKVISITFLCTVLLWVALTANRRMHISNITETQITDAQTAPSVTVNSKLGPIKIGSDADDPAIWQHPTNPQKSLFFLMDKTGIVTAHDFSGNKIQEVKFGTSVNNIDTRTGLNFGGQQIDILTGNLRDAGRLAVMRINPNWTNGNAFTVLAGPTCDPATCIKNNISKDSYGFTLFKSKSSGKIYTFEKPKSSSPVVQWEIDGSSGKIDVKNTGRSITGLGVAEGFVGDDINGFVYFAQESGGIYKYYGEPTQPTTAIGSPITTGGVSGDWEGLTLYSCNNGRGYLILSSQGNSQFKIYDTQNNAYVRSFTAAQSRGTDGLDVTSASMPGFPNGVVIIHNDVPGMNYHLYDWADVAQSQLTICPNGGAGGPVITPPSQNTASPTSSPVNSPISRDCQTLQNRFTISNPSGYTFTKACTATSSEIYQNENRFTFFRLLPDTNEIPYIKTPNTTIKDLTNLNWSTNISGNANVYILFRKIPGQTVPNWISSNYTKLTPASFADVNQFVLRKNEQGLIGVYDVYRRPNVTGTINFQAASTTAQQAYSMYTVAINPL